MRKIHLYLLLCVVAFATGCPKYRPSKVDLNNTNAFTNQLNTYFRAKQAEYSAAIGTIPDGDEKARRIRNQFIEEVVPFIDEVYMDFITDIQAGRDRDNFVADLIELGTSAAVGITNGERPLQILGIGLTAFRGGRRSADLNFYREQTTPVLINKMDSNRARVRSTILTREKEGIDTYPIGAAIADIIDYYNAGTLVRAFTELQKDTAAQTKQAEADLVELKRSANILLAPTEDELRISNQNASAIDALADAYVDANDRIEAAQERSDTATQTIESATQRIEEATQRAAAAQARIDAENAKNNPNQTTLAQANADRTLAEADKTKAEADKTKAEVDKTQAETDITAATTERDAALANLKGTYDAIEADPALEQLLEKIPDIDPGYSAQFKDTLRAALQRLKESKPVTTDEEREQRLNDYVLIIRHVAKVVRVTRSQNAALNERLQTILKVNQ